MTRVVIKKMWVKLGLIGDQLAIRGPNWRGVTAGIRSNLSEVSALIGVVGGNHPNVRFIISVGIRRTIARERKRLAIRRPRRFVVIKIARSDLRRGFCRDVEDIKMRAATVQVTNRIALKLKAVNHEGRRSLGLRRRGWRRLFLVFGSFEILRLGIAEHQHQPRAVGRPFEIVHTLRNVSQANRFSAAAIEQPHLRLSSITRGQK